MVTSVVGRSRRYAAEHFSITDFSGKLRSAENHDAHCVAYQILTLAGAAERLPNVGEPLQAGKWFQRDYRSFAPRGGSIGKRATTKRWAEH